MSAQHYSAQPAMNFPHGEKMTMVKRLLTAMPCLLLPSLLMGAEPTARSLTIEEQVVHVRKRPEPSQKTPAAVSVFDGVDLDRTLTGDLEGLEGRVPSLIVDKLSGTPGGAAIAIRGVGDGSIKRSIDPAVPVIIDGVNVGTSTARLRHVFDFHRVEVARGPQSTILGKNTLGGAIIIERTRPTGELGGEMQVRMGDYDSRRVNGVFHSPRFFDQVSLKVAIDRIAGGGDYVQNCKQDPEDETLTVFNCNNSDENDIDYLDSTIGVLWEPTEDLDVYYTYEIESDDSNTRSLLNLSDDLDLLCIDSEDQEFCASDLGIQVPQTVRLNFVDRDSSNRSSLRGYYHTLNVDWQLTKHRFTTIVGIREHDEFVAQDLDGSSNTFLSTTRDQDYKQLTWDTRLVSTAHDKLSYIAGAQFLKRTYTLNQRQDHVFDALQASPSLQADDTIPRPASRILSAPQLDADAQLLTTNQKYRSLAFFGHMEYVLSDQWRAALGVRFAKESKTIFHQTGGLETGGVVTLPEGLQRSRDWTLISPMGSLSFKVDEQSDLYLLLSHGNRSGGFDEAALSAEALAAYGPEKIDHLELGLKTRLWDDRLRLQVAGFQYRYNDKQEGFITETRPGWFEAITQNIAKVHIDGTEVELEVEPFENLLVRAAFGHLNAEYSQLRLPSLTNPGEDDDLQLFPVRRAPTDTAGVSIHYGWDYGPGRIQVSADYRRIGDYFSGPSTIPAAELDPDTENYIVPSSVPIGTVLLYSTWDLSIAYVWKDWRFRAFSRNVNDRRFVLNSNNVSTANLFGLDERPTSLLTTTEYNDPRFTALEVTYRPQSR